MAKKIIVTVLILATLFSGCKEQRRPKGRWEQYVEYLRKDYYPKAKEQLSRDLDRWLRR